MEKSYFEQAEQLGKECITEKPSALNASQKESNATDTQNQDNAQNKEAMTEKQWDFSGIYSAADLPQMEFKETVWIIPNIIPEGLTIFGGKPKFGKSWFVLNICLAASFGGKALGSIQVNQFDCLYLALEDTPKRMKNRINICLSHSQSFPKNLNIIHQWERIDNGGLEKLDAYLTKFSDTKLVIIDTIAKIWGNKSKAKNTGQTLYNQDYDIVSSLKNIADKHKIAIICVTHLRKTISLSNDPLEEISGSMGISGSADTAMVIKRDRGNTDAVLTVTGRDIEEQEIALNFDKTTMTWQIIGDAKEFARSKEQLKILEVLKDHKEPMSLNQIAQLTGKKVDNVSHRIKSLIQDGLVNQTGYGKYIIALNNQLPKQ